MPRDGSSHMSESNLKQRLAAILAATPKGLHRSKGWDELPTVGAER